MNSSGPLPRHKALPPGGPLVRRAPMARGRGTNARKASSSTVIPKSVKDAVDERDEWTCQRCARPIGSGPFSRHHRDPRGMGGSKADPHAMANLVLLCGTATTPGYCHAEVEGNRAQARIDGWLVPMNVRPDDWPARRFGLKEYQQPGPEWTPAEPHPMQLGDVA